MLKRKMSHKNLPDCVLMLCNTAEAWIVGSAADPENKETRNIEVIVPFEKWECAIMAIPSTAKPNSFRGFKFLSEEGVEIDVWPMQLGKYMLNSYGQWAWNPVKNIRIQAPR